MPRKTVDSLPLRLLKVKYLVDHGAAKVDAQEDQGFTSLRLAEVKYLVEHGAGCPRCHLKVVEYLFLV